jgi:hypothetical protein
MAQSPAFLHHEDGSKPSLEDPLTTRTELRVTVGIARAMGASMRVVGWGLLLGLGACGPSAGTGRDNVEKVVSAVTSGAAQVNSGGPALGSFVADTDFSGGATLTRANTIDLGGVVNPPPMALYQSQRYNNMTYTFPGFTAGASNDIRLHFADTKWTTSNQRLFNVTINGALVLSNFDIIAAAGAPNKAVAETFTLPANSSGQYVIQFVGTKDATMVCGIEVAPTAAGICDPSPLSTAGWVASASATSGTNTPAKAIDGSVTTRWTTGINQASGQYFQLDLGAPRTFSRIVMNAGASGGEYPHKYNVFVSNDGVSFGAAVASGTGIKQIETVDFASQTARYLRVVLTGTATTGWSIYEMGVFAAGCVGPQPFTIKLPDAAGLAGVGLAASNNLHLANTVMMTSPRTGLTTAVNTGGAGTDVGTDASVGSIISQSSVTVRDRSVVNGNAQSAGTIALVNGAQVKGTVRQNTPVTPLQTFTWSVTVPNPGGDLSVPANTTSTIAPGSYGNVSVNAGAALHLGAGTYFLKGLSTELQSQVVLDGGPVFLYIVAAPDLRGAIVPGAQQRHLLMGVIGSGTVLLESSFIGTIVAPNAVLRFAPSSPATYTGSFFAKDIDVEPAATIALDTFADWQKLFPLPATRPVDVHPQLTCVAPQGGGIFSALFGYVTDAFRSIRVLNGPTNVVSPAPGGGGQVQLFFPGKVSAAFATSFSGAPITWTTAGGAVSASSASPLCPTTACSPGCATGETCVGGSCVTLCGDGVCAGEEGCETCPADCGCGAGDVCFRNGCASPPRCGGEWQCGSGSSFGVTVTCGACAAGGSCVNHVCQ